MDFTSLTIQVLEGLKHIAGSYGLAIILLTIIIRLVLWPLSVSQQRSMKKMQNLSPKLKEIQNRYKSDPQVMQKKMMEFYKEHKFNPMGGCFPLILQMPVFILLYSALMSPQFIEMAGKSSFLFINRLDATMQSHSGVAGDHIFGVEKNDKFTAEKVITVYKKNGSTQKAELTDPKAAVEKQGEIVPGKPVDLKVKLDAIHLPFSELDKVQKASVKVVNENTKEIETLNFSRKDSNLISQAETEAVKKVFHPDVMVLVILFAITMFASQKVMTSMTDTSSMEPAQQAMQKQMSMMMPFMITSMFIFFPIPAGVLLYLIVSNVIQVVQTWIINRQIDIENSLKPQTVTGNVPNDAKQAKAKATNTKAIETESEN